MNSILIEFEQVGDEDCNVYIATASRNGISADAYGNEKSIASRKAIEALQRKEQVSRMLSPNSPNFENTIEAFLCRD